MWLEAIFFYLFASVTVMAAFMVIMVRNPVHSVLFLILAFFNASGLFLLAGAEFLALVLLMVYVGAVAVLFLFVVMMLDVDFVELRQGVLQYLPIGSLVSAIVLIEMLIVYSSWKFSPTAKQATAQPIPNFSEKSNIVAIGDILYTRYFFVFQISGLILLVAMIGAIILTLRHRKGVRRQDISKQIARNKKTAIEIRKVESGKGI